MAVSASPRQANTTIKGVRKHHMHQENETSELTFLSRPRPRLLLPFPLPASAPALLVLPPALAPPEPLPPAPAGCPAVPPEVAEEGLPAVPTPTLRLIVVSGGSVWLAAALAASAAQVERVGTTAAAWGTFELLLTVALASR